MHLRLLTCWVPSILLSVVAAQDYDFGFDMVSLTRRQDPKAPIVVGRLPSASNGSVPLRLEVREMKADKYKWDLFILALSIHGVPFETWNEVEPVPGASQSGYCTHSSVLFPMWHRPYLALYEELYKLANAISRMYSNSTERMLYQQAASDFRIPYWDWASPAPPGESFFPDIFWDPVIAQYGPNGLQAIRNPLYSYSFHPLDEQAFIWDPLKQWNETKRAPDTSISLRSPPSMNDQVNTALLSKLPEIQQRLYALFSSYHDFNSFSNKAWAVSQNLSALDSVEAVHDIIHIYGGSRGHMTYVPLSSFDPLFFLHHTMTDRLVAMWQLINPTAWITSMPAGEASYTSLKGTVQNSTTPLTPFMSSADGTFWTSDMSRSTETFGYAYADTRIQHGDSQSPRERLIRKINRWLGGSSPMGLRAKSRFKPPSWRPHIDHAGDGVDAAFDAVGFRPYLKMDAKDPPVSEIIKGGYYTEWVANVHVNMETLGGSFTVHFFIGEPPEDGREWSSAPNLAGSIGIFTMNRMTGSQSKISGAVPLTSALVKLVASRNIPNLAPNSVVPLLQKALRFRILEIDENEADPALVEGLHVSISSSDVRAPNSDAELPEWGVPVEQLKVWG
ncbi:Tyrosinase [Cladobotryum mycophilum]|uniref:tyrosinase n=1 Tax=Cladobotryum mycophilum TaxID=491253 RepID=A0ABR0SA33_9HYPO